MVSLLMYIVQVWPIIRRIHTYLYVQLEIHSKSIYCHISGMGQTEFDIMDLEDQKLLEREMLTLLGLTHVPENAVHKVK